MADALPPIPPARPVFNADDRARIGALIDTALSSGALTLGPCGRQFEELVASSVGVPHAVAVSSGTAALEIVLRSLDVQGRDVIVPANTFYATAGAVVHAGGRPVFADVAADTLALSRATVEAALDAHGGDVAGVVHVHIGGLVSPEVPAIAALCAERGIFFMEDAAHAHGSTLDGKAAGAFGQAGTFSFYPTKVVASGEGGMIVTADERIADEARLYRDQGKAGFLGGEHVRLGYAWRMSELHAAVAMTQWERLDEFLTVRRGVARRYDEALADLPGATPVLQPAGSESNYYKYLVLLEPSIDRDVLKKELREGYGVSLSGEVYARPLHVEPIFADVAHGPLPVAEHVCAHHVCLPVHSDMTDAEATRVIDAFRAVVMRASGTAVMPASGTAVTPASGTAVTGMAAPGTADTHG
ncbi:MAG: DegT/DnrJ/EryC1/StrS aminotransferase family protein [Actinobacteria bacterium]|nr:DegT/DnrJ/EryC1/StrS aminotransferase family protein [Actinomycetota bacterium]